jgi:hypothetical protein
MWARSHCSHKAYLLKGLTQMQNPLSVRVAVVVVLPVATALPGYDRPQTPYQSCFQGCPDSSTLPALVHVID